MFRAVRYYDQLRMDRARSRACTAQASKRRARKDSCNGFLLHVRGASKINKAPKILQNADCEITSRPGKTEVTLLGFE